MGIPGGWELILVVLVIMVLFGAKRLPDSARALGRSMRILKAETKGLHDDDRDPTTTAAQVVAPASPPGQAPPAPPAPYDAQAPYTPPAPPYVPPAPAPEQAPHRPA